MNMELVEYSTECGECGRTVSELLPCGSDLDHSGRWIRCGGDGCDHINWSWRDADREQDATSRHAYVPDLIADPDDPRVVRV